MIVKPSISWISASGDADLIKLTTAFLTAMGNNANLFPNPKPALSEIIAALNAFTVALANAEKGGVLSTAIKNSKRVELESLLRMFALYLADTCGDNLEMLIASGFPYQKPDRTPQGIPPIPSNLAIGFGAFNGQLVATITPLNYISVYNWRIFEAANPTVILETLQSTGRRIAFNGLKAGVLYSIQVNAVNPNGASEWSKPVSQMAV